MSVEWNAEPSIELSVESSQDEFKTSKAGGYLREEYKIRPTYLEYLADARIVLFL